MLQSFILPEKKFSKHRGRIKKEQLNNAYTSFSLLILDQNNNSFFNLEHRSSILFTIFEHKKWTKTFDVQRILVSAGRGKKKKKNIHSCKMLCKLQGMIVNVSSKAKTF